MNHLRTWIEIDAAAFAHNIAAAKILAGPSAEIGCVLKANAYGHGIQVIALLAEQNSQIAWLLVSDIEEALQLRALGCRKKLLVLSCAEGDLESAILNQITLPMIDLDSAERINRVSSAIGMRAPVHIKVDSGMHRLGFLYTELTSALQKIAYFPGIRITGIFAHLATTNEVDTMCMDEQVAQFYAFCKTLDPGHIWSHHIIASGALGYAASGDIVRIGTMLYGSWKTKVQRERVILRLPDHDLRPIITWKTRIMQVKVVAAGECIGYDRTFRATRTTHLGILPVGYADGYPRALSNNGVVLVNNCYAPVVGLVSMNLMAIDITTIPSAMVGAEVILVGQYHQLTPGDLAQQLGTNPNVLTSALAQAIPRFVGCSNA